MDLNEFQERCYLTAKWPPELGRIYTVLGLAGEAGEVANNVKKIIRDCRPKEGESDKELAARVAKAEILEANIKDELGDCLYYVAAAAREHGYTLEDIALATFAKLQARHG